MITVIKFICLVFVGYFAYVVGAAAATLCVYLIYIYIHRDDEEFDKDEFWRDRGREWEE